MTSSDKIKEIAINNNPIPILRAGFGNMLWVALAVFIFMVLKFSSDYNIPIFLRILV